jgi:hypothetical protein
MRHRASSAHIVLVPVPMAGANLGWLRRPPPNSPYPPRAGRAPPNQPPQPIPLSEWERRRLADVRRDLCEQRARKLLHELDGRKGAQ